MTKEPSRPYSIPRESSLVWLRKSTTGAPAIPALCMMAAMRPELLAKHVVSNRIRSTFARVAGAGGATDTAAPLSMNRAKAPCRPGSGAQLPEFATKGMNPNRRP